LDCYSDSRIWFCNPSITRLIILQLVIDWNELSLSDLSRCMHALISDFMVAFASLSRTIGRIKCTDSPSHDTETGLAIGGGRTSNSHTYYSHPPLSQPRCKTSPSEAARLIVLDYVVCKSPQGLLTVHPGESQMFYLGTSTRRVSSMREAQQTMRFRSSRKETWSGTEIQIVRIYFFRHFM